MTDDTKDNKYLISMIDTRYGNINNSLQLISTSEINTQKYVCVKCIYYLWVTQNQKIYSAMYP